MRLASRSALVLAASLPLAACGITGNFRNDPGYADFGPQAQDTHREIGLSLGPLPLGLARMFVNDDPELGPILKDLRAARVYIYDVDDPERVADRIATTQSELIADGWFPIVTVRDDGERVAVLTHANRRGELRGMAVIVQESEELVLVNLIGEIHLDQFDAYMAGLDVHAPSIAIDPATLQAVVR
jgi:hypothetical protein